MKHTRRDVAAAGKQGRTDRQTDRQTEQLGGKEVSETGGAKTVAS